MRLARLAVIVDINEVQELSGLRPLNGSGLAIGRIVQRLREIREPSGFNGDIFVQGRWLHGAFI